MKFTAFSGVLAITAAMLVSCKKEPARNLPLSSLNIINALIGGSTMKVNGVQQDSVRNFNAGSYGLAIVNGKVSVKVWPSLESNKPYYTEEFEAKDGDLYSLFLFGEPGIVESLLIKEQIPERYTDSVVGVRVAHCAPGGGTINVNVKSDTSVPIISQVNYQSVSQLVKVSLPSRIPTGGTSFEIRDGIDNKVLTTYTLPVSANSQYPGISISLQRFKNITLVVKGSRDTLSGSNRFGVFPVVMSF